MDIQQQVMSYVLPSRVDVCAFEQLALSKADSLSMQQLLNSVSVTAAHCDLFSAGEHND